MKKNNTHTSLSKTHRSALTRQLIFTIVSMVLYTIAGAIALTLGIWIYDSRTYYGGEHIYQIAQFIQGNLYLVMLIYLLIGFTLIILHFMKKPYREMSELMDAAKAVYTTTEQLPELSSDLGDFSLELAKIQLQLRQNERAAKEAEQRKNDLVVYLAHDLKTPLTSVIGYLSLLHDEREISPELQEKYLGITLDKAQHLEDLINEFFDITRFNLTTLTLEPANINLTMMLQQLTYEFAPMLCEKQLQLKLNCPEHLMYTCDPDKMQRVFDNLLRNAVNYSYPKTDISIHVWTTDSLQESSVTKKSNHENASDSYTMTPPTLLHIDFTNHGQTIIPEKLSHIFEQFYRLDSSRSTKNGGAGLGLAIAKEIVTLHHGTITVESEQEMIRFHLELPLL